MNPVEAFEAQLTAAELHELQKLDSPFKIQVFLDAVEYPSEEENRSPAEVLRQHKAHCLDGGLFAAAALRRIGFPPRIIDLQPEPGRDDDHVLALFKIEGCWGALAKSNYSGLRFREAVYRSIRELVMSYFNDNFNILGEKTLRSRTRLIALERLDKLKWMTTSAGVDAIETYIKQMKTLPLITASQARRLSPVDKRSFDAGTLGINLEGVYQVQK